MPTILARSTRTSNPEHGRLIRDSTKLSMQDWDSRFEIWNFEVGHGGRETNDDERCLTKFSTLQVLHVNLVLSY